MANCLVICNGRKFINANCTSLFHFCNYFILLLDQFSLYVHKGGLKLFIHSFIHSFIQASISCTLAILQPWFNKFFEMLPQINQTRLTKCKFSTTYGETVMFVWCFNMSCFSKRTGNQNTYLSQRRRSKYWVSFLSRLLGVYLICKHNRLNTTSGHDRFQMSRSSSGIRISGEVQSSSFWKRSQ